MSVSDCVVCVTLKWKDDINEKKERERDRDWRSAWLLSKERVERERESTGCSK